MNYLDYFNKGMEIEEYKQMLGKQLAVYNLHFKKAIVVSDQYIPENLKILTLVQPGCADTAAILSVVQKFFENSNTKLRILKRDDNPDLMDQFLTNGGRAVPLFIIMDEQGNYLARFGPRPEKMQNFFEEHREAINKGEIEKSEIIRKIRNFYAKDRGRTIINEFKNILKKIQIKEYNFDQ
ncbi:MAG: thioredoxin family protein [Calditrichaceae bacterium]|jgi:hypothetical protein